MSSILLGTETQATLNKRLRFILKLISDGERSPFNCIVFVHATPDSNTHQSLHELDPGTIAIVTHFNLALEFLFPHFLPVIREALIPYIDEPTEDDQCVKDVNGHCFWTVRSFVNKVNEAFDQFQDEVNVT